MRASAPRNVPTDDEEVKRKVAFSQPRQVVLGVYSAHLGLLLNGAEREVSQGFELFPTLPVDRHVAGRGESALSKAPTAPSDAHADDREYHESRHRHAADDQRRQEQARDKNGAPYKPEKSGCVVEQGAKTRKSGGIPVSDDKQFLSVQYRICILLDDSTLGQL